MNLQKFKDKGSADNEMPRPLCNVLFVKGAKKKDNKNGFIDFDLCSCFGFG